MGIGVRTNQSALSGTGGTYDASTEYTLAFWMQGRNGTNGATIFVRGAGTGVTAPESVACRFAGSGDGAQTFTVYHNNTTTSANVSFSGLWFTLGRRTGIVAPQGTYGSWIHVAFTWSSSTNIIKFYINGKSIIRAAMTLAPTTGGTRQTVFPANGSGTPFTVSDIRWWHDKELNPAEINAVYRNKYFGYKPAFQVAIGNGTQNGIDRSGNGNNMTTTFGTGRFTWFDPPHITNPTLPTEDNKMFLYPTSRYIAALKKYYSFGYILD